MRVSFNTPAIALTGLVTGFSGYAYFSQLLEGGEGVFLFRIFPIIASITTGIVCLFAVQHLTGKLVRSLLRNDILFRRYSEHRYLGFLPMFLCGLVFAGFRFSIPFMYLLLIICVLAHAIHLLALLFTGGAGRKILGDAGLIPFLFFLSGFSALIYELVWQRVLFYYYGVNIESVTIIVAIFMLGMGLGSLLGGYAADSLRIELPRLFIACEAFIGIFGLFSIPLIHFVGERTLQLSGFPVSLAVLCLLLPPTVAMGATLPILVKYLFNRYQHVGRSAGTLYFANTIGGGVACLLTVDFLFTFANLQHCVVLAALLNISVSGLLVLYISTVRFSKIAGVSPEVQDLPMARGGYSIPLPATLLIAFFTGYLSLSQELIWVRIVSFTAWGMAPVFGHILGLFLIGIALGAKSAERFCRNPYMSPLKRIGLLLTFGGLGYFCIIALFIYLAPLSKMLTIATAYTSIVGVAFVFGNIFPIVCHFGIHTAKRVGKSVSWIYLLNICGSTLGPLVTGFLLLDALPVYWIITMISGLSVSTGLVVCFFSGVYTKRILTIPATAFMLLVILFSAAPYAFHKMWEKLRSGNKYRSSMAYSQVIENKSGVIAVEPDTAGDIVWSGGVYDGRFNVDPNINSNGIQRALMISGLHANPDEILEIGLSTGSWSWIFSKLKLLKHMDIVEINPGYLEIIRAQGPPNSDILSDHKVSIHLDDGRRWLQRHPEKRFDLIVMNTSFHFRNFTSALLSRQFLQIAKKHLYEGGVLYFNTTYSRDAEYTVCKSFRYVVRVASFIAASDSPIALDERTRCRLLLSFEENGKPLLDTSVTGSNRLLLKSLSTYPLNDIRDQVLNTPGLREITDENMLTEYKSFAEGVPLEHVYEWKKPRGFVNLFNCVWKMSLY